MTTNTTTTSSKAVNTNDTTDNTETANSTPATAPDATTPATAPKPKTPFNAAKYAQYLRSASAQREQLLVDVYNDTDTLADFTTGCELVALKFATSVGVSTQTIGMLSTIGKIPEKALAKMLDASKEKFDKTNKDSTALLFAKLLVQYTAALTTVLKYANVVDK